MKWTDIAATAWSNLGRRKVRTALTSTGVVVGILTVVTLISLVNGVQLQVRQQFEKIGLDRVVVRPRTVGGFGGFGGGGADLFGLSSRTKLITPADVTRWKKWPEVKSAAPEIDLPGGVVTGLQFKGKLRPVRVSGGATFRRGPFAEPPTAVVGSLDLPETRGSLIVSRGTLRRFRVKERDFKTVLGQNAEVVLQAPRGERQRYPVKIIGVSSEGGPTVQVSSADRLAMKSWWFDEPNPLKTDGYDSVSLQVGDVSEARTIVRRLRAEKWEVQSIDAILDVANRIFTVITAMMSLIGGVTLLVACIGIANTMIMSIYERTREIGTLKAMGASRNDIRAMFMIEAGLIGLLGGVVGLVLSWLLGRGLNPLAAWAAGRRGVSLPDNLFILTPSLAFQALAFAFLIGMIAGLYPANRAARLDPLAALRHV
jgi:putative ABC transport system permease protein